MKIGVAKEYWPGEVRTALVPANAKKLIGLGFSIVMEKKAGSAAGFSDADYSEVGVELADARADVVGQAEVLLAVRQPAQDEISSLRKGAVCISFLDPFNEKGLIEAMAAQQVTAISMEMIPRSTRAQKMDALSSQANLAGYVTVVQAAFHCPKIMPMMMTPAGTIAPARVFVIGAGVAGLQAIATAKRLGARVEAFDTRPVVAEQVQSLGGKFVEIDLGDTGQTEQGYAKELTPAQLELQRQGQKQVISQSDVVITTAQLAAVRRKLSARIWSSLCALVALLWIWRWKAAATLKGLSLTKSLTLTASKLSVRVTCQAKLRATLARCTPITSLTCYKSFGTMRTKR